MRYLSIFGVFGFLPIALSQSEAAPENVVEYCKQIGQIPQKTNGIWGCVQTSSICGSDQDQSTLHKDSKTGEWSCCSKGEKQVDGTCKKPGEQTPVIHPPQPGPGICGAHLKDAKLESLLRALLSQCFPYGTVSLDAFIQYYITILHGGIDLIEIIYKNGCDNPDPGPDHPPKPPVHPWWKCPADNSAPCKWLPLEVNKVRKPLPATSTQKVLPNPNVQVPGYKYPFDTLVTKFSDDDLDIYIKDQKLQPQNSGTSYLIPAGTSGNDVYYKSSQGTSVQFYGACSEDTPCVGDEVVAWADKAVTVAARDADIDVSSYDYDLVFTLADISFTTEQYTVLADGKEVGKTHGRLSLGDDKYNTKHIATATYVDGGPLGALRSIANDGFWGSFHIPKDTKKVTVHLGYEQPGWPNYIFEYRMDKLCKC